MGLRLPAHGGALLLGGLAVGALIFGLLPAVKAAKSPAIGAVKSQAVSRNPKRGIAVVGFARGRRARLQYAGGCRGLRLRHSGDRKRRFAAVIPRNGRRCGRRPVRKGRVKVTVCGVEECVSRRIRISPFRDSDGDGIGNLFERLNPHPVENRPPPGGAQPGTPETPSEPLQTPLSPLGQIGCEVGQVEVTSAAALLDAVETANSACVTAAIGNVRLEGLGSLAGVTVSSEGDGSLGEVTVKETSNLTVRGARLRSIEIRRANGTQVIGSVIGGTQADRVYDQLIFMPEASRDVTIESNDIGWTIADDSGNTGYGCRCYGNLDNLRFVGNRVHDIAADGFQGVGGEDVLIDRNEIGSVGANPGSSEHSDNIQITGNGPNLRITNNWIHLQGYFDGKPTSNSGSTYIHGDEGAGDPLIYENNLIETALGRTEICGLGTGGTSRSNITVRRNTWVDGGKAFPGFPGFEWDCDSGSGNLIERNIAVDPDGGFAQDGSAAAAGFSQNIWGTPGTVTLDANGNCTSSNCTAPGGQPIGYRKPSGVHW
ncbi:MAG TPA: right-handed parallel beta-helix repeat-containing protein [Solirubrobacterales bacterium]|nr:right-handed parallel beta-helix repeat-containing protein [Solirubrobacterales bacterium]